jgi:two-component system response regulator RegX3
MNGVRVLIVEDEVSFIEALTVGLEREGFNIEIAKDGSEALVAFERFKPDLILLDLMLPKISGIDVCRQIRNQSDVPIIMVTAKGEEIDTVVGLEVGADDYVTKPYRLKELVARMRTVLRRTEKSNRISSLSEEQMSTISVGDVVIDTERHEVKIRGEIVSMPLKEFELLAFLMQNTGIVLTRDTLIDRVWGMDYVGDTKTLDVHIKRLRSKIEEKPGKPENILTVRGLGYKYNKPKSEAVN